MVDETWKYINGLYWIFWSYKAMLLFFCFRICFIYGNHLLAQENHSWRIYWVDPGDMRTQMHQDAFPGEDISDRPLPEASVPGFLKLLNGQLPSGRYQARTL